VKQLWDDPWPTIFTELPPGKVVTSKVLSVVDYGVFVRIRDGIEGLIPQNDLVLPKDESGAEKQFKAGDDVEAEIANIDTQERRITLSMRRGEGTAAAPAGEAKPQTRASKAPKKSAAAEASGGTIGELIKQKLGAKLAGIGTEKEASGAAQETKEEKSDEDGDDE
jgi:small subunit ribosomal protein S1